jgi:Fic family protein
MEYFFNGVARQSEDALSRAERINQQLANWREAFAGGGSKVPLQLIALVGSNPFLTPRDTARRLGVAYNTVMRAIAALEAGGVLTKVGGRKRDRVFCARAILEILEEPARLVPESPAAKRRNSRA